MNCNWRNRFKLSPKEGLTVTTDFTVKAREIDFVTRFAKNWEALRQILGIVRPIKKQAGTVLTSSKASLKLKSGLIGEGEEIPYSEAKVEPVAYADLTLEKFAKAVSIESVNKYGAAVAVQKTDEAFLNELQNLVLFRFYDFASQGQLVDNWNDLQMAVAMAIGNVKDKFKKLHKDASRIAVWINTLDAYKYIGAASLTVQTQFGLDYMKGFLGADTVILSSEIPSGFVYATPVDNIVDYYADPGDYRPLGLDYTVQGETNLIGFHASGDYSHAVGESYAVMGFVLWAELIDAISVVSIGGMTNVRINPENGVTEDEDTGTLELSMLTTDDPVQLSTKTIPYNATITWTSSDSNVATVSGGKITAVGAGTATITATTGTGSTAGAKTATLSLTVTAPA